MKYLLSLVFLVAIVQIQAQNRVLYGQNAPENEFQWMSTIYDDDYGYHCGATLIADRWVITARHCVVSEENLKVVINPYYQSNPKSYAEERKVVEIHFAPGPDNPSKDGHKDIVLLKLDKPSNIVPIKLATLEDVPYYYQDSFPAFVLGWGFVDTMYTLQDTLKIGKPVLFDQDSCAYLTKEWIRPAKEWELCAGYKEGTPIAGGAAGDSGGPLFVEKDGDYLQVGVVSRGNSAFTKVNEPGIYFHVAELQDWIEETVQEAVFTKDVEASNSFDVLVNDTQLEINKKGSFDQNKGVFYIVDMLGHIVQQQRVLPDTRQYVNIQFLQAGMYFLVLDEASKHTAVKFVKKR